MKNQEARMIEDGIEVPESALHRAEGEPYYGSVPGLSDDELASAAELERQVMLSEWGPILALPCKASNSVIRPIIDEAGHLDWGAFGTWDFERLRGPFDKARYKADKLQKRLLDTLNILDMLRERLPEAAQRRVRELALHTEADLDDIEDYKEWAYARYLRGVRERAAEIRELRGFSRWRRQRERQA